MAENQEQDEDEENAPEPLGGEEALDLARDGKDAWNAWAEENPGRAVDFENVDFTLDENKGISFEGFTFPGKVNFSEAKFRIANFEGANFKGETRFLQATFKGDTWFGGAVFEGNARFGGATFEGYTRFHKATFKRDAGFHVATFEGYTRFDGATFKGDARFDGGTFTGPVNLHDSRFRTVPDFRRSEFKKHVTLHGMEVKFRRPTEKSDADKYRRLKELAVNARDHDREQEFFAYELMAKRDHEKRWLARLPSYLYEWTSDFGRSLRRPSIGLFGIWFAFGVLYRGLATKDMGDIWDGLLFSVAQLFPFLGASRGALGDAREDLFGKEALSVGVNALGMLEGGLGFLFLFLIGLALRNRFRI